MILNATGIKAAPDTGPIIRPAPARYTFFTETGRAVAMPTSTAQQAAALTPSQFNRIVRAANAVATLAFGLMGSLVGLMAFRASDVDGNSDPT
jgi:hypothetical protein